VWWRGWGYCREGQRALRQPALVLVTLDSHGVQSARVVPFEIDPADCRLLPPGPQVVAARIRLNLALPSPIPRHSGPASDWSRR